MGVLVSPQQFLSADPCFSHFFSAPAWAFPTGYSPSGTDCSSVGYSQATSPARKPALHGLCTGCSILQGMSTSCGTGPSTGCSVYTCSGVVLHGLQGANLLHHGLHHMLLCSSAWSTSSPSFSDLDVCRAVSLTFFSSCLTAAAQRFFSLS